MSFDKDLTFSHDRHGPSNKVITKNRYPRIRHFPTVLTNARFIIFSFPTWPAVYWNDFTFVTPSSLDGNKMVVQEFHRVECCYALVKCLNSPCQHNVSLGQTSRENNQLWNQVLRSIKSQVFFFVVVCFRSQTHLNWWRRTCWICWFACSLWRCNRSFSPPRYWRSCSFLSGTDNDECFL